MNDESDAPMEFESRIAIINERVAGVRAAIARASALVRELHQVVKGRPEDAQQVARLEIELETARAGMREISDQTRGPAPSSQPLDGESSSRKVESDRQVERLMNLYVVVYQLHGTFVPDDVLATVEEIAINVVGASRLALLMRDRDGESCTVRAEHGLNNEPRELSALYSDGRYHGGDAIVDAALDDGVLRIADPGSRGAIAAVPLAVNGVVVGALAILELLEQRPPLGEDDRELLEILGVHAGLALTAAEACARSEAATTDIGGPHDLDTTRRASA